jgi:transcriptional antiterminator RfaH
MVDFVKPFVPCKQIPIWYVAYTRSRYEHVLERLLNNINISAYIPKHRYIKQWSDRKKLVEEPLFKSYVFVHATPLEYHLSVTIPGFVRYVHHCGKPAVISEKEMEFIRIASEKYENIEIVENKWAIGDRAIIVKGALKGHLGTIVQFRGKYRVAFSIESLGLALLVDMPISYLEKIVN